MCVRSGGMIPLDNVVRTNDAAGPQVINHFNLLRSAEIDGAAAPGYSSGQGLKSMEQLAHQNMLQGMTYSWAGWRSKRLRRRARRSSFSHSA